MNMPKNREIGNAPNGCTQGTRHWRGGVKPEECERVMVFRRLTVTAGKRPRAIFIQWSGVKDGADVIYIVTEESPLELVRLRWEGRKSGTT